MNDDHFEALGGLRQQIDSWFVDQDLPTNEYDEALQRLDTLREALYAYDELCGEVNVCQENT